MSYTVKKSDGTTLATVPENEVVTNVAPVALVGRGATIYGLAHSENFVHLTENFANTTPPANALEGMLWWDKTVGAMKVRKGNDWALLGGGGGGTGAGGVTGTIYVDAGGVSILVLIAGGKVIAALSPSNVANSALPVSIVFLNETLPFRARFPYGLEAGHNLADDPEDYIYNGHVPRADASIWAGGGNPFAATTFVDLGPTSVALTISNNKIIAAYSQATVAVAQIPVNFTVNGITMPFKAVFPNGISPGLTLGDTYGIRLGGGTITGGSGSGALTLEALSEMITDETEARATAISTLYTFADAEYAKASILNQVTATFTSATGQTSVADAINYIVATAGSGTSGAQAIVDLKAEIKNAITGSTSFAHALSKLNTVVTADLAEASDLTLLESNITDGYTNAISTATQNMLTTADLNEASAGILEELEANFETETGYQSIASAVNDLKTIATGTGSVVSQDTDFRTQFTNAMKVGEADPSTINSVAKAFDKLKLFSTADKTSADKISGIESAFKTLTGTASNESFATAVNKLATTAALNTAISTNNTLLKSQIANEMAPGQTTIASAVTEIIQQATSGPDGSSNIQDSSLRSTFVQLTNEAEFPVTTVSEAITKLMTNSTKDRANSAAITELQNTLTGATGTNTVANAKTKLTSTVTKADAAATFETALKSALTTETGTASWSDAIDRLATYADEGHTAAQKVTTIESQFLTSTGQTNVASAIQTMWTKANSLGSAAGYSMLLDVNGYVTGLSALNGGPGQSELKVLADKFLVADPANPGGVPAFEVSGGAAYIKGERIQSGSITQTQVASVSPFAAFNTYPLSSALTIVFAAGSVPTGARCFLGFNVTGRKTGSDDDTYYVNLEKYSLISGFYAWRALPSQEFSFTFISGDGCSAAWTFVDNSISAEEATGEIRYRVAKRPRSSGNGIAERITLTAMMGKK